MLWGFISAATRPAASPEADPLLDRLVGHADRLLPGLRKARPRATARPDDRGKGGVGGPRSATLEAPAGRRRRPRRSSSEVYEVGKRHGIELKAWFQALYEVLLGQSRGPRMGSFIALYGVAETVALIRRALAGEDLGRAVEAAS